ncbi:hypothetical protein FQA39_LY08336 [Lamprigera yunnana]|nr:hypothetical protein FQA39_LY08336 [Lamprigera yunnana]
MLVKFMHLFQNNSKIGHFNLLHKYVFKMDKAYLRKIKDTDQFEISFHYSDSTTSINRQFNFCRNLNETIAAFLNRITINVEKVLNKKKAKKKSNTDLQNIVVNVQLLENTELVNGERTCKELFVENVANELILSVLNKEYAIVINSPWINTLQLPKSIMANFPVYPSKFEADLIDKNLSEFMWFKSNNKNDWILVGSKFIYIPNNSDVQDYLKITCLPRNENAVGPIVEVISDIPVEASPGYCPFETRHKFTVQKTTANECRIVSYNILADLYTDSEFSRTTLFPYCPVYALSMDYRKQLIMKELIGYNADIICLQELDRKIFINDIEPVFNSLNYTCSLQLKGGEVGEGLGCIFSNERFRFLESCSMVYGEQIDKDPLFADIWEKISLNQKLVERFTQRTTVIGITVLECLDNNEVLLVANTHLYFHPDSDHIRLLQGAVAIRYVNNKMEYLKAKYNKKISLVFCGDFNSVPECGIYKLYTEGFVSEDFLDWRSNEAEAVEGLSVIQPLQLDSACGTPKYTNFTKGFAACLDYIYYNKSSFEVTQIIPFPSDEELMEHVALPSVVLPSDHIALVADLKWR